MLHDEETRVSLQNAACRDHLAMAAQPAPTCHLSRSMAFRGKRRGTNQKIPTVARDYFRHMQADVCAMLYELIPNGSRETYSPNSTT
jgi:hypothetical protein